MMPAAKRPKRIPIMIKMRKNIKPNQDQGRDLLICTTLILPSPDPVIRILCLSQSAIAIEVTMNLCNSRLK